MNRMIHWVAVTVCMIVAKPAAATDRYFLDQHVTSSENVVRLDVTSPDNAGTRPQPFAKNFTYKLTRMSDGKELWSRKQDKKEASPLRAFVHDDGWVIVWDSWNHLLVLDKDTGAVTATASIFKQFPKSENRKYVHHTTAGPMWSTASDWRFATHAGRTVFVITTGWGRILAMDVAEGKFLQLTEVAERELLQSRLADAREILRVVVLDLEALHKTGSVIEGEFIKPPASARQLNSALVALLLAEDTEIVPSLRYLEQCAFIGTAWIRWPPDGVSEVRIRPFLQREFTLRRIAQMGLRRLGEKPAELSGVRISDCEDVGISLPAPRAERVELVKQGMGPREVLESIGHPDFVRLRGEGAWEYDIDDDEPYTLVIHIGKDSHTVDRAERVPPKWKEQQRWADVFAL